MQLGHQGYGVVHAIYIGRPGTTYFGLGAEVKDLHSICIDIFRHTSSARDRRRPPRDTLIQIVILMYLFCTKHKSFN